MCEWFKQKLKFNGNHKMINSEEINELKQLVKKAVYRNMVVFDSTANPGTLTVRLIELLQDVSRDNRTGNIVEVYARGNSLQECDPKSINNHIMIYAISDEIWDKTENYYKNDLQGSYAEGDNNLVIALSNTNEPLIGSF